MAFIKRKIEPQIWDHLTKKEISLIVGPRQAGKTTLLHLIQKRLQRENTPSLFLNLDVERHSEFFTSQDTLLQKISLELPQKKGVVFIDEIQRKENAGLFLKGIYDMNIGYKFVVSGSGSLELKESIHESLAGRKRIFELYPISFEEFLHYRTEYRYEDRLREYCSVEKSGIRQLLTEYLTYGGFPRVVLEQTDNEKRQLMDEIYRSYIEKDIVYLININRPDAFSRLMKLLAAQIGTPLNYNQLASDTGLSVPTVKRYLWYAERTFSVKLVTPYFTNKRKEITKSPVVYFIDLGLRNYITGSFGQLTISRESAMQFQNFIYVLLVEFFAAAGGSIHFWRTLDKAEVDFVIDLKRKLLPVEVKYSSLRKPTISRSFRSFIGKYKPDEGWVVNLDYEEEVRINSTVVRFIPFFRLLEK